MCSSKSLETLFAEIELEVNRDLDYNRRRSNISELHQSIPDILKRRLTHLLPMDLFSGDELFEEDQTKAKQIDPDLEVEILRRLPTLDHILEERDISVDGALDLMSRAYEEVKLISQCSDESHQRFKEKKELNWIADYVKKRRRHRIQWDSKLYRDNAAKNWHKKSMIENVEAMIELSAAEFADWCNSLAGDGSTAKTVTPDLIKQLFSIETEGSAPRGLHVEPVDQYVLPPVVVRHFDPNPSSQLDLEFKMEKLRKRDRMENARKERHHAFGRTLSNDLKWTRRRGLTTDMKPDFPEELCTKEALFKGIEHLQVTRSIFDHIKQGRRFPVPDYLRKNSLFNRSRSNNDNP